MISSYFGEWEQETVSKIWKVQQKTGKTGREGREREVKEGKGNVATGDP